MNEINVLDGQDKIIHFGTRCSIILDQFSLRNPPYATPSHLFSIKNLSGFEYKFVVKVYQENAIYKLRIDFLADYNDKQFKDMQFFFAICAKTSDSIKSYPQLDSISSNISIELMSDDDFKKWIFDHETPFVLVFYIFDHSPGSQKPVILTHDTRNSSLLPNQLHTPNQCQLSTDLFNLYEKGDLSDFRIVAKNKTFNVHKCVLAARSPTFIKYFERIENDQASITLDVSSDVVEEMLRFMYTNSVNKLDELVDDLYEVAKEYDLRGLKDQCVSHMAKGVSVDNAMRLLHFAKKNDEKMLQSQVTDFFVQNTEQILASKTTDEFLKPVLDLDLSLDSAECSN